MDEQQMDASQLRQQVQDSLDPAYKLQRELGGGGMSRVFVAEEVALARMVVIKVLSPNLAEGLSADRFAREIRLAARLQHPHIVPLFSAGEAAGLPYYTMPFVEGESLAVRLARDGTLSIASAMQILRDIARPLE
jgi:serine/threonine protein kinase